MGPKFFTKKQKKSNAISGTGYWEETIPAPENGCETTPLPLKQEQKIVDAAWHGGYYEGLYEFLENNHYEFGLFGVEIFWYKYVAEKTRELLGHSVRIRTHFNRPPDLIAMDEGFVTGYIIKAL
jgi:hypothetical protein